MTRWLWRGFAALIGLPALFVIAGFVGALIPGAHADLVQGSDQRIGLIRGPIHFDFLLPLTPQVQDAFGFATKDGLQVAHPQAKWLVLGWGAQGFYTTTGGMAEIKASVALKAALGDASVIRLDLAGDLQGVTGVTWLDLSNAQLSALLDAIAQDLLRGGGGAGNPVLLTDQGLTQSDLFYKSTENFSLFHTCNAWVGEKLRQIGLPLGVWTPLPQSVELSLRLFN
ncbi:MAG: hypothetical protein RIR95_466 [Pseudomonadota bacterium]